MISIVLIFSNSIPFHAYLVSGSDPEITVSPMTGILKPADSKGTMFVVAYKPTMYGKKHQAKLIVQVHLHNYGGM